MIKSNYFFFLSCFTYKLAVCCPISNAASLVFIYKCSEFGFNLGMLTVARSLNNPSYDDDLLNHIHHATPKYISGSSKICNEIRVLMQKCRTPVTEPSLYPYSISSRNLGYQSSVSRFTKAGQSNLMVLSTSR